MAVWYTYTEGAVFVFPEVCDCHSSHVCAHKKQSDSVTGTTEMGP